MLLPWSCFFVVLFVGCVVVFIGFGFIAWFGGWGGLMFVWFVLYDKQTIR
jgi:hypothetical protein